MQHRLGDNENWMRSNKCLTGDPQGMTENVRKRKYSMCQLPKTSEIVEDSKPQNQKF